MAKRQIIGQVLASTGPVVSGTPIPPEALKQLFEQTPAQTYLYQHHDSTLPPVGRLFNKRLETRSDGTLVLMADVEFEEGVDPSSFGGFSISFLGNVGYQSNKTQAATIYLDTRYFDVDDLRQTAGDISDDLGIGSRQLYRYSVGATVATVVITLQVWSSPRVFFLRQERAFSVFCGISWRRWSKSSPLRTDQHFLILRSK